MLYSRIFPLYIGGRKPGSDWKKPSHNRLLADLPDSRQSHHDLGLNLQQLHCWETLWSLYWDSTLTDWARETPTGIETRPKSLPHIRKCTLCKCTYNQNRFEKSLLKQCISLCPLPNGFQLTWENIQVCVLHLLHCN